MSLRLLLTPDAESGGGDAAATKAEAVKPAVVTLDESAWKATQDELARFRSADAERAKAEKDKAEQSARDKGKWDELLAAKEKEIAEKDKAVRDRDEKLASLDRESAESEVRRSLADALSGLDLVPGAAAQLIKLWRDDFKAERIGGEWVVKARDGRSAAEVVKAQLASDAYAHFVKAGSRGGAGADATRAAETAQQATPPRNLGEALINVWKDRKAGNPNDLSQPRGFHGEIVK